MTDESRGGNPVAAASRLPRGAGIILRHDASPQRAALAATLALLARTRGLTLLIARDAPLALRLRAGLHLSDGMAVPVAFRLARGRIRRRYHHGAMLSIAAHGPRALAHARAIGADLALLSPVFPTLSHPGARSLGTVRFARLARAARLPVAALGGITAARVVAVRAAGACAVAAIGALTG